MNTVERLNQIITEKNLTLYSVAQLSGVNYSTLKMVEKRQGQLSVDTIELLCNGLGISMCDFFAVQTQEVAL